MQSHCILSLTYSEGKDDLSHAFFLCHTWLCPVCHHLKTAKAAWKMTFPRGGKKKTSWTPYLLFVHEKHSSTNLTLSILTLSPFLTCLFRTLMDVKSIGFRIRWLVMCYNLFIQFLWASVFSFVKISIMIVMLGLQRGIMKTKDKSFFMIIYKIPCNS